MTDHVLDAIDSAIDDWTVSADAMRSRPEPADRPTPVTRMHGEGIGIVGPPGLDHEAMSAAFDAMAGRFRELGRALQPTIEAADEAVFAAQREYRDNVTSVVCPNRRQPDPKAWVVFTNQPTRRRRT
jgi:hypothetical protein